MQRGSKCSEDQNATRIKMQRGSRFNEDQDAMKMKMRIKMQHGPRILVQDATMIKMYRGSRCNEDEDATRIKMQHGSTCNQSGERYNAPYVAITIRLGQMNGLFEVFLFIVLQSLTNS